jgi:ribonuclease E
VPSTETLGIRFLRKLGMEFIKEGSQRVLGTVPVEVADYLLNRKRKELLDLEEQQQVKIRINADPSMVPGDSTITCE